MKSYHLSAIFMFDFNTLIYSPFHLGMILRILPHLPTVKGSGGPFIRGQGRGGKGRGECRSDRLCSHCCKNNQTFDNVGISLIILYGLIKLPPLLMVELLFLLLFDLQVVAGNVLPYL